MTVVQLKERMDARFNAVDRRFDALDKKLDANLTPEELDRIVGSVYACVEQCFRPALRIGFASRVPS